MVFRSAERPVALPVNFKTLAGAVIFRSALDGEVAAITSEEPVSFEVDRIDDAMSEGWSVLATGTVHSVRAAEQIHEVQALGIEPWAGGERDTYFRLSVTCITGKRINAVRSGSDTFDHPTSISSATPRLVDGDSQSSACHPPAPAPERTLRISVSVAAFVAARGSH